MCCKHCYIRCLAGDDWPSHSGAPQGKDSGRSRTHLHWRGKSHRFDNKLITVIVKQNLTKMTQRSSPR